MKLSDNFHLSPARRILIITEKDHEADRKMSARTCLLAGDIGGTKTSLALHRAGSWPGPPLAEATYRNAAYDSPAAMISEFLAANDSRPDHACFGVAGPVHDNRVRLTNLDWFIDGEKLRRQFGLKSVSLVNDLVATAMGAVHLPADRLKTINGGQPASRGAIAVIAPGTGLGEAFIIRDRDRLLPCPSEGGHASFAPENARQAALLEFMQRRFEHVSVEQVCSGLGLPSLYDFLKTEIAEPPWLAERLGGAGDRTPVIVAAALKALNDQESAGKLAVATLHLFVDILAAEAANLALKVLATGGVYIGGGIPPRILPLLEPDRFMARFRRGVYREMLGRIPVHVILEPETALLGAAACGFSTTGPLNR